MSDVIDFRVEKLQRERKEIVLTWRALELEEPSAIAIARLMDEIARMSPEERKRLYYAARGKATHDATLKASRERQKQIPGWGIASIWRRAI